MNIFNIYICIYMYVYTIYTLYITYEYIIYIVMSIYFTNNNIIKYYIQKNSYKKIMQNQCISFLNNKCYI